MPRLGQAPWTPPAWRSTPSTHPAWAGRPDPVSPHRAPPPCPGACWGPFSGRWGRARAAKGPVLLGGDPGLANRLTGTSFEGLGTELFQLAFGRKPRVASADQVDAALDEAALKAGLRGFSKRFLAVEWAQANGARRVGAADAYGGPLHTPVASHQ